MTQEVIENAIDDWLTALLIAEMGVSSAQPTLKLRTVKTAILYTIKDWLDWGEPPLCGLGNRFLTRVPHGVGGATRIKKVIPYVLTFVVKTEDMGQGIRDTRTLLRRAENVFRATHSTPATWSSQLTATSGEHVTKWHWLGSERDPRRCRSLIRVLPDPQVAKMWHVCGDYGLEFETGEN